MAFEDELGQALYVIGGTQPTTPIPIYLSYWSDEDCKSNLALLTPQLSGAPFQVINNIPNDTTANCAEQAACVIDPESPQCEEILGGIPPTFDSFTDFVDGTDDDNCDIFFLNSEGERSYLCECNPSSSLPGCYFKFFTADEIDKIVAPSGGGGGDNKPQNVCENITSEKKCGKKSGGKCVWVGTSCVDKNEGGLGFPSSNSLIMGSESIVGAEAIEQSNSGYAMNGQFSTMAFVAVLMFKVFN